MLALMHIDNSDRLAMSILWGTYALGLIVFGLMRATYYTGYRHRPFCRDAENQLFFYDMAAMSTIYQERS